jgi:hypothetical protein
MYQTAPQQSISEENGRRPCVFQSLCPFFQQFVPFDVSGSDHEAGLKRSLLHGLQQIEIFTCVRSTALAAVGEIFALCTCPDFTALPAPAFQAARADRHILNGFESLDEFFEVEVLGCPLFQVVIRDDLIVTFCQLLQNAVARDTAPAPDAAVADLVLYAVEIFLVRHSLLPNYSSYLVWQITINVRILSLIQQK